PAAKPARRQTGREGFCRAFSRARPEAHDPPTRKARMTQRTVIITGASDGIGAAGARALSARGDRVVVVGRSPQKTRASARSIGADFFVADFARLADVRRLAADLLESYPRIDVLANNAGSILGA